MPFEGIMEFLNLSYPQIGGIFARPAYTDGNNFRNESIY